MQVSQCAGAMFLIIAIGFLAAAGARHLPGCAQYCNSLQTIQQEQTINRPECACFSEGNIPKTHNIHRKHKEEVQDSSSIYYEPSEEAANERQSFTKTQFNIENPVFKKQYDTTTDREAKTIRDLKINELSSSLNSKSPKAEDILQSKEADELPIYLDIDVYKSDDYERSTDVSEFDDFGLTMSEDDLTECLDLHILVLLRNTDTDTQLLDIWNEEKNRRYNHISDSDLMVNIENKCYQPINIIKDSLQAITKSSPKKSRSRSLQENTYNKHLFIVNSTETSPDYKNYENIQFYAAEATDTQVTEFTSGSPVLKDSKDENKNLNQFNLLNDTAPAVSNPPDLIANTTSITASEAAISDFVKEFTTEDSFSIQLPVNNTRINSNSKTDTNTNTENNLDESNTMSTPYTSWNNENNTSIRLPNTIEDVPSPDDELSTLGYANNFSSNIYTDTAFSRKEESYPNLIETNETRGNTSTVAYRKPIQTSTVKAVKEETISDTSKGLYNAERSPLLLNMKNTRIRNHADFFTTEAIHISSLGTDITNEDNKDENPHPNYKMTTGKLVPTSVTYLAPATSTEVLNLLSKNVRLYSSVTEGDGKTTQSVISNTYPIVSIEAQTVSPSTGERRSTSIDNILREEGNRVTDSFPTASNETQGIILSQDAKEYTAETETSTVTGVPAKTQKLLINNYEELDSWDFDDISSSSMPTAGISSNDPKIDTLTVSDISVDQEFTTERATYFYISNSTKPLAVLLNKDKEVRPEYTQGEIQIAKILTKELYNDSVISLINGTEDVTHDDFLNSDSLDDEAVPEGRTTSYYTSLESQTLQNLDIKGPVEKGFKFLSTKNQNIVGKLYFLYGDNYLPARFVQDSEGSISIGLDAPKLCDKLKHESVLLVAICKCLQSKNCTDSSIIM